MFTVYSKPACPFCDQAKQLLDHNGIPYQVMHLDVGQPRQEGENYISREELLALVPSARTMPQIHDGSRFIGGFADLKSYLQQAEELG